MAHRNKITLSIEPQVGILLSLFILLIPLRWTTAWLCAALVHELCHVLAVILCGKRIHSATVTMQGIILRTELSSPLPRAVCSLAGPVGGLIFAFAFRQFPRLALCTLIQSAYNLLPVYPLDGNHAMRALAFGFLRKKTAEGVVSIIEWSVLILLLCCSVYLMAIVKIGFLPLFFTLTLAIRSGKIKIPCKEAVHGVQ